MVLPQLSEVDAILNALFPGTTASVQHSADSATLASQLAEYNKIEAVAASECDPFAVLFSSGGCHGSGD